MSATIYHNPRCSSSRRTLELLRTKGIETKIVEYLKVPPDAAALQHILTKLGVTARDIMRKNEAAYASSGLDDPAKTEDELIAAIVANPILLQRPIVVSGGRAAIGRPPEAVLEIL